MSGESYTTTDHAAIRRWIEERDGKPATVKGTPGTHENAGLLRVYFPQYGSNSEESLEPISWEEFFDKFESSHLAFLCQNETKERKESRFFKFISRESHQ